MSREALLQISMLFANGPSSFWVGDVEVLRSVSQARQAEADSANLFGNGPDTYFRDLKVEAREEEVDTSISTNSFAREVQEPIERRLVNERSSARRLQASDTAGRVAIRGVAALMPTPAIESASVHDQLKRYFVPSEALQRLQLFAYLVIVNRGFAMTRRKDAWDLNPS
ncbi:hypothetical protein ARMSODRAFT_976493 [Armillaria solidipes]|uniref:Uncharacterized protein n=1 Tax=Armillaria solidipes TaxID=1076256 RepID=A0A2H3BNV4_9AGAR|nr:hypothetical protein ARMSODRAFT_976493 [Armillaria solidipes]